VSKKRKAKKKGVGPPRQAPEPPPRQTALSISTTKRLLFACIAVVSFFGLVELLMALAGVRPVIIAEDPYVGFESYLPLFRLNAKTQELETAPNKLDFFNKQRFSRRKAPNTFRIFTLGGSTTYGHPFEDGTSFSGWLRAYLEAAAPERNWEVINCGAISYASYRVAKVMEELVDYQPDLFIVYSGNNEFLERRTYSDIIEEPAALRSVNRLLGHSRLYALARKAAQRGAERAREKYELTGEVEEILNRSTGLDAYYRDDSLREQVLSHYRYNLGRMRDMARASGAQMILVTVPVNEKDFAPFKSQFTKSLDEVERRRVQTLLDQAKDALAEKEPGKAKTLLLEAVEIDPRYADTHYLLGRAWLALEAYDEAERAFLTAIEEDVCPLRALAGMNEAIFEIAQQTRVPLVDFRETLKTKARREYGHGLLGDEFFLDHVHPTVATNGILARSLTEEISRLGILDLDTDWHSRVGDKVIAEVEGRADTEAHARAYKNLSKVLIWAGKKKEAERYARQAEELLGEDWEVRYNSGVVNLEAGDYDAAIASFREAIRINPNAAVAYDYLSAAYASVGKLDEAIAYGERAVQIDPSLASVHSNLAASYITKGELERARKEALKAVELDPDFADAHNNLGNAYLYMGRPDEALESYDKAIQLQPEFADALVNRGLVLGQKGRFRDSIASFLEALEIDNNLAAAHMGLGKAYLSLGQSTEAVSSFERVIELDDKNAEAYERLVGSYLAQKRIDKVKEVLARGLRASPEDPLLLHRYGQVLAGEKRYDEAIRHFERAIAASTAFPDHRFAKDVLHRSLAAALLARDRVEEGLTELKRAAAINPTNAMIQNDLGLVYENLGQLDEALAHYQRALELEPRFAAAKESSDRIDARMRSQ